MSDIDRKQITCIGNKITEEIVKDEALAAITACYQCGRCTGSCPSGRRTAMRTRQIVRKALLNLDEVLSDKDLWLCSTCYTCYERCPRDVPTTNIIIKLRNLATQRDQMLDPHRGLSHMFIKTGHGVPIAEGEGGDKWRALRESYGLAPLPDTVHSHPEAVEDVNTLMKSTKFDKLVGYGKDKEEKKEEEKEE